MKTRIVWIGVSCALLMAAGAAGADATRGRGEAVGLLGPGASTRANLDRRLAVALSRMDENLLAMLGPATLDCAGDFVEGGLESCVVRLDLVPGAGASAGAASD